MYNTLFTKKSAIKSEPPEHDDTTVFNLPKTIQIDIAQMKANISDLIRDVSILKNNEIKYVNRISELEKEMVVIKTTNVKSSSSDAASKHIINHSCSDMPTTGQKQNVVQLNEKQADSNKIENQTQPLSSKGSGTKQASNPACVQIPDKIPSLFQSIKDKAEKEKSKNDKSSNETAISYSSVVNRTTTMPKEVNINQDQSKSEQTSNKSNNEKNKPNSNETETNNTTTRQTKTNKVNTTTNRNDNQGNQENVFCIPAHTTNRLSTTRNNKNNNTNEVNRSTRQMRTKTQTTCGTMQPHYLVPRVLLDKETNKTIDQLDKMRAKTPTSGGTTMKHNNVVLRVLMDKDTNETMTVLLTQTTKLAMRCNLIVIIITKVPRILFSRVSVVERHKDIT